MNTAEYHQHLNAVTVLALPLCRPPGGLTVTEEVRLALYALEQGCLKVQLALLKEQLATAKGPSLAPASPMHAPPDGKGAITTSNHLSAWSVHD